MKTMIKSLKSIGILLFLFLLNSGFEIYSPGVVYSPSLKTKNDLNMSVSLAAPVSSWLNIGAAYAIDNHTGLMIHGISNNVNHKGAVTIDLTNTISYSNTNTSINKIRMNAVEIGAGCFYSLGRKKNRLFQLYGGIGGGSGSDAYVDNDLLKYMVSSKFYTAFLQTSWAYTGKYFESELDLKANYVRIYSFSGIIPYEYDELHTIPYMFKDLNSSGICIEPVYTMKVGSPSLKAIFQFGLETNYVINSPEYEYNWQTGTSSLDIAALLSVFKVSIGISFTFRENDFKH